MNVVFAVDGNPDTVVDLPAPPRVGDLVPYSGFVRRYVTGVEWRCDKALGWHVRLRLRMRLWDWLFAHAAG